MPVPAQKAEHDSFVGTERFQLVRHLGSGAMGSVFEAFDRERNVNVAIKTLNSISPDGLLRLKKEFRDFQDLAHPNLISVGELLCENGVWFFTMELIDGINFLNFMRPGQQLFGNEATVTAPAPSRDSGSSNNDSAGSGGGALVGGRESGSSSVTGSDLGFEDYDAPTIKARAQRMMFDEPRLRAGFTQLAKGLNALHDAGKVHRDVKPSNILVTRDGRVVLLDFGLATDAGPSDPDEEHLIVGTVAYMAPEQASGANVGSPSDWYALGVMLYEALTGNLPFSGKPIDVLLNKQQQTPPSLAHLAGVPPDLGRLCDDLLAINPSQRPSGRAVLARLSGSAPITLSTNNSLSMSGLFVGRERELATLDATYRRVVSSGSPAMVTVQGDSGVGKSALVRRFVHTLRKDPASPVILRGTCYERETVPYKAIDGIIDALAKHLSRLNRQLVPALLPEDAALLLKAFPVLAHVEAFAGQRTPEVLPDATELRRRVFRALRELLQKVSKRSPLALVIDDLHWADADSLALLQAVLQPPDAPPLILIVTSRTAATGEEALGNPAVNAWLAERFETIQVDRLSNTESIELARSLLHRAGVFDTEAEQVVAREAAGHPLFIDELTRQGAELRGTTHLVLDEALSRRASQLEPVTRRVLKLIALSAGRLQQQAAARAADLDLGTFAKHVAMLRVAHLAKTTGIRANDFVEPYHHRVRVALRGDIGEREAGELHGRLALAIESSGREDPEALAYHWAGAKDAKRAKEFAVLAAEKSMSAFAFDRAAQFFEQALALSDAGTSADAPLRARLGEALANLGRGHAAAKAFLTAAENSSADRALELRRRAGAQLVLSGYFNEGLKVMQAVLQSVDLELPKSTAGVITSFLWRRGALRLRGIRFRERSEAECVPAQLMRIDAAWSIAFTLAVLDTFRSAALQTRNLLLALSVGEPHRVARALALEAVQHAIMGPSHVPRSLDLLQSAEALGRRTGLPYDSAFTDMARGVVAFQQAHWRIASEHLESANRTFREQCRGVTFELQTNDAFRLTTLFMLGRLKELRSGVLSAIEDAEQRGDLFGSTSFRLSHFPTTWLLEDAPEHARKQVRFALERLTAHTPAYRWYHLLAEHFIDLYTDERAAAFQRIEAEWPKLKRQLLMRVQAVRMDALWVRGTAAMANLELPQARKVIEVTIKQLRNEKTVLATASIAVLQAGLAKARGDVASSCKALEEASALFTQLDMALHAGATRAQWGALVGGEAGAKALASVRAALAAEGAVQPDKIVRMIVPGLAL